MSRRLNDNPGMSNPRVLLGFGLILFGAVLLLDRLDVAGARDVLRFWPLLLIAYGLQQFFTRQADAEEGRRLPVNGIIWMAIGGIFLLNSLGILRTSVWSLFWPIVLITVGVRLMTRGSSVRASFDMSVSGSGEPSADVGPMFALLSGVKRVSAAVPFRGTDITVFMGGAHLDLRRAVLDRGAEAVIDVFNVMGGCDLMVPPDWVVSAPLLAVMGGVDDKRIMQAPTVIEQATGHGAAPPRLVLRGMVLMGGITIRS